jgi:hypothetical protein
LKQIEGYELYSDWVNFKVGLPHSDASAILLPPVIDNSTVVGGANYLGVDVGKISWFIVINVTPSGMIRILHLESSRLAWEGGTTSTLRRAAEIRKTYAIRGTVVDSMPDLSLSLSITNIFYNAYASEYTRNAMIVDGSKEIYNKRFDVVKVWRTGAFNEISKKLKLQYITMPSHLKDEEVLKKHLKGLKKVVNPDNGEEFWEKVSADHYAHALLYALVAADSVHCNKIVDISDATITNHFTTARVGSGTILDKTGRRIY